jgi:hypothetical protein
LINKLHKEFRNLKTVVNRLRSEGIVPPKGIDEWTEEAITSYLSDYANLVVRRNSNRMRFPLYFRSVQNKILKELKETGFSQKDIADLFNEYNIPSPRGLKWLESTVAKRFAQIEEDREIKKTVADIYPWRKPSVTWNHDRELDWLASKPNYNTDDINETIVKMRHAGMTFSAIAKSLNEKGIKNKLGAINWDDAQMKKRIDAYADRAVQYAKKQLEIKVPEERDILHFTKDLDKKMVSPKQIAELFNSAKVKRLGEDTSWDEVAVGHLLSSLPRLNGSLKERKIPVYESPIFNNAEEIQVQISKAKSLVEGFENKKIESFQQSEIEALCSAMHYYLWKIESNTTSHQI